MGQGGPERLPAMVLEQYEQYTMATLSKDATTLQLTDT